MQPPPGSAGAGGAQGSECGPPGSGLGCGELAGGEGARGRCVSAALLSPPHGRPGRASRSAWLRSRGDPERGRGDRGRRAAAARERVRGGGGAASGPLFLCSPSFALTLLLLFFFFFFFEREGENRTEREMEWESDSESKSKQGEHLLPMAYFQMPILAEQNLGTQDSNPCLPCGL